MTKTAATGPPRVFDPDGTTPIQVRVTQQGAIIVDQAWATCLHNDCALIELQLTSKNAQLAMWSDGDTWPGIALEAGPHTCDCDDSHPRTATTWIDFPEFAGWRIHSITNPARYSLSIALHQERTPT